MSRSLCIGYHTVLRAVNDFGQYKGASLVFQELVWYCVSNGISIDEVANDFYAEQGREGLHQHCSNQGLGCKVDVHLDRLRTQKCSNACAENLAHFAEMMSNVLCTECKDSGHENAPDCLVRRTLENLIDRMENHK